MNFATKKFLQRGFRNRSLQALGYTPQGRESGLALNGMRRMRSRLHLRCNSSLELLMMQANDTLSAIERLQYEVRALTDQQNQAIRDAIYATMTSEDERQFDERRRRIALLRNQILRLQQSR